MATLLTNLTFIDGNWKNISKVLEPSTDEKVTTDDIYANLMDNSWNLWMTDEGDTDGYAVTSFIHYPRVITLRVIFLASLKTHNWEKLILSLENFATLNGCHSVEIIGRPGWKKALPSYEQTSITLRKKLNV